MTTMAAAGASSQGASARIRRGGVHQHRAPARRRRPQTQDPQRKRRLRHDERGHEQRRLHAEKSARRRQQMAGDQPPEPAPSARAASAYSACRSTTRIPRTPRATVGHPTSDSTTTSATKTCSVDQHHRQRAPQREHHVDRRAGRGRGLRSRITASIQPPDSAAAAPTARRWPSAPAWPAARARATVARRPAGATTRRARTRRCRAGTTAPDPLNDDNRRERSSAYRRSSRIDDGPGRQTAHAAAARR